MNIQEQKSWFYKRLSQEAFFIAAITYVVLVFLELLKPGMISNYLSLPHSALILLALGMLSLVLHAPATLKTSGGLSKRDKISLIIASILVIIFVPVLTQVGVGLTVTLIFVTVLSLWLGTLAFNKDL